MVISKINPLIRDTIDLSMYPPELVEHVMEFIFTQWREYLMVPTSAGFRLPHLGVIRPSYRALNTYLLRFIKRIRENPEDKDLIDKFRIYWNLRSLIRNDSERREYKKKFGTWHYK